MPVDETKIEKAYELAKERFAALRVDTDAVIERLLTTPLSIHCWQGDDVGGFEASTGSRRRPGRDGQLPRARALLMSLRATSSSPCA